VRIAVTGGTGFLGRHVVERLADSGHEVVAIGSGHSRHGGPNHAAVRVVATDVTDSAALSHAFAGCEAVVHCAGINRQIGDQTYERVHVQGTASVIEAARRAWVSRVAMVSFLRARPDGPDEYHRSKWAAEELVRTSELTWTVVKCGVIYGLGDHMLDHLSHAFYTFPIFGLVGMRDRPVRPAAVDDVARVLEATALGDPRMANRTLAVLGPEQLLLGQAVRRIAEVVGRRPIFVRVPVVGQLLIARAAELLMRVPLVSIAQVHILAEGIVEPLPFAEQLPVDLLPQTRFDDDAIRAGLPLAGGFSCRDLRFAGASDR
jgi:NADH dehydrogenase